MHYITISIKEEMQTVCQQGGTESSYGADALTLWLSIMASNCFEDKGVFGFINRHDKGNLAREQMVTFALMKG